MIKEIKELIIFLIVCTNLLMAAKFKYYNPNGRPGTLTFGFQYQEIWEEQFEITDFDVVLPISRFVTIKTGSADFYNTDWRGNVIRKQGGKPYYRFEIHIPLLWPGQ